MRSDTPGGLRPSDMFVHMGLHLTYVHTHADMLTHAHTLAQTYIKIFSGPLFCECVGLDRVSLCSEVHPRIIYVTQASLELVAVLLLFS